MSNRPVGVTILAVLHLIGGGGILLVLLASGGGMARGATAVGLSPVLMLVSVLFLIVLGLSSGVGMLLGKEWGWWLGAFWYVYAILRYANALLFVFTISSRPDVPAAELNEQYVKYGGRIVVSLLLLLYLFKGNVLEYFSLYNEPRGRLLVKLGLPAAAIVLVAGVSSYLGLWNA